MAVQSPDNSHRWFKACNPTILELEKIENSQLHKTADQLAAMLFTMSRKNVEPAKKRD
jgi:hypothetical protein